MVGANLTSTLIRTSTLLSEYIRKNLSVINTPIQLHVGQSVGSAVLEWTEEEVVAGRKLVYLDVALESHANFHIEARPFKPESKPNNEGRLVISCIKWDEQDKFVVTSVDVILVLEHLVGAQFSIEEKSRIRRNLQFLKPSTITRSNGESKRLFNSIMAMENPRPRNIEKDLKVFEWSELFKAVRKVLSKYSANPEASLLASVPSNKFDLLTASEANARGPGAQRPLRGNYLKNNSEEISAYKYPACNASPRDSTIGFQQIPISVPVSSILELPQQFITPHGASYGGLSRAQAKLERQPKPSYLRCGNADNARPTQFQIVQA